MEQKMHSTFMLQLCCPLYPNCPRGKILEERCQVCDDLLREATSDPIEKVIFERNMEMLVHLNKQKQCFLALSARARGEEFKWDMVQGLSQEFIVAATRWVENTVESFQENPENLKAEEWANLQRLDFYIRWCGAAISAVKT
jgi:hypothetical protein